MSVSLVFFFQAEDGIRDFHVTGVQTCALPMHHLKGVAKAVGFGVERGEELKRFEFGVVTAPARGELLKLYGCLLRLDLAEAVAQLRLPQLSLRGRRCIARCSRKRIGAECV